MLGTWLKLHILGEEQWAKGFEARLGTRLLPK